MDKSIEQALTELLPTLSGPLPLELRELAVSLLAQSRIKASSLKADEEIARSYVCANLACERCEHHRLSNSIDTGIHRLHRLKQTLALPKIQPRPPCPPRIYQKLYRFLNAALPARVRRSDRALKVGGSAITPTSSPAKPRTPIHRTPLKPTTPRRKTPHCSQTAEEVPDWVMPTIRHLCKSLGALKAPPHVFAGVSSILTLPPPRKANSTVGATDSPRKPNIAALIVAVLFIVTTRLAGVATPADEYTRQTAEALAFLKGNGVERGEQGDSGEADVNDCMREIRDKGWTELDWFTNIPIGGGLVTATAENNEGEASADEEGTRKTVIPFKESIDGLKYCHKTYLQAGLGTMVGEHESVCNSNYLLHFRCAIRLTT